MNFSPQAQVTERSPLSRRSNPRPPHNYNNPFPNHPAVTVTILIYLVDLIFNLTAGHYAALTGARINSWSRSSSTAQTPYDGSEVAILGGQAGLFKSAILAVWHFGTAYGGVNMPIAVLFAMASSRFGVAVLVTCFVSTMVLGTGM